MWGLTHLKRRCCWGRLRAEGDDKRMRWLDGINVSMDMVWVDSWRPGVLRLMGSQESELNWTEVSLESRRGARLSHRDQGSRKGAEFRWQAQAQTHFRGFRPWTEEPGSLCSHFAPGTLAWSTLCEGSAPRCHVSSETRQSTREKKKIRLCDPGSIFIPRELFTGFAAIIGVRRQAAGEADDRVWYWPWQVPESHSVLVWELREKKQDAVTFHGDFAKHFPPRNPTKHLVFLSVSQKGLCFHGCCCCSLACALTVWALPAGRA